MKKKNLKDCLLHNEVVKAYYDVFNFSDVPFDIIIDRLTDIVRSRYKPYDQSEENDVSLLIRNSFTAIAYDLRNILQEANEQNHQLSDIDSTKQIIMSTIVNLLVFVEEDPDIDPDYFVADPKFVDALRDTANWVMMPENFPNFCITAENKDQKTLIQLEPGEFDEDERERMIRTLKDGTVLDLDEIWQYFRTLYSPEYDD